MNEYKILFHPEARKEFDKLDGSIRKVVLKQLAKLRDNPGLGEKLGHKAGLDLTGYRKMYAYKKKIRIVYRIHEGKLLVFIVAVGKREDMSVYRGGKGTDQETAQSGIIGENRVLSIPTIPG